MKTKNVLIISYTFPPSNGIGGRRWAKFAKYLTKNNINTTILTIKNSDGKETSPWDNDIKDFDIRYIDSNYPSIIETIPQTFVNKVRYHLTLRSLWLIKNGSVYDRALFLKKRILFNATKIINEKKIDTIVITGAPFRLLYYGTLIKAKHPNIKLISDFRDPWAWSQLGYGYSQLNANRLKYEQKLESKVIENSDLIYAPVQPMVDHLKQNYKQSSHKIDLLPHAYDEDDLWYRKKMNKNKLKLIYGGTIYEKAELKLMEINTLVCESMPCAEMVIYTNTRISDKLKNSGIQIKQPISSIDFLKKVSQSDFFISIYPTQFKDFISTKYYEIIACRTPIILVGPHGFLSEFICTNNLGFHILHKEINTILKIVSKKTTFSYNHTYPIEQHSFSKVTQKLISKL